MQVLTSSGHQRAAENQLGSSVEGLPGTIFVTLGRLNNPRRITPMLEMFTKRRLAWAKPLDGHQSYRIARISQSDVRQRCATAPHR
jgi:hypothetical protein